MTVDKFEKQLIELSSRFNGKRAIIIDIRIDGDGDGDGDPKFVNAVFKVFNQLILPIDLLISGASINAADHLEMNMTDLPKVTIIGEHTQECFQALWVGNF